MGKRYSLRRRAAYSATIIALVLALGTLGMHFIEGMSLVDSFYFTSLIATGEGPSTTPETAAGKIFASFLSFISIGSVVASLIFLLGPFAGTLLKYGIEFGEEELKRIEKAAEHKNGQARKEESSSGSK